MLLDVRPIKTEADYSWALKEIEAYFDKEPEPGSKEAARFDILATLISAYESEHYPMDDPETCTAEKDLVTKGYLDARLWRHTAMIVGSVIAVAILFLFV